MKTDDQPGGGESGAARPRGLRGVVGVGMIWMMATTIVGRFASFGAQIALGYLLMKEDFGVAAMAISSSGLIQVMRDGGCRQLLIQKGADEYGRLSGSLFWMSFAFNMLAAGLIVALAGPIAVMFDEPRVRPLLYVMALYPPLSTPAAILMSKLTIELRFGVIARVVAGSAVLRHGSVVLLAFLGYGPMSFAIAMPVIAVYESVASIFLTRSYPWMSGFSVRIWRESLAAAMWIMLGTLSVYIYNHGDYLVLGVMATTGVVGVYFFAYQLSKQVIVLLMVNLQTVLFPALTRLKDNPVRQRTATLETIRLLMLLAAPLSFGLAATIGPIEELLWRGRWVEAVDPIRVLSVVVPFIVLNAAPRTILLSLGQFRMWSLILLLDGLGIMVAAAFGGWVVGDSAGHYFFEGEHRDPLGVAVVIGVYAGISALVYSSAALRVIDVNPVRLVRSFAAPMLFAVIAGGVAFWFEQRVVSGSAAGVRLLATGVVFAVIYGVLVRSVLAHNLRALVGILPGRLQRAASTALRLRESRTIETGGAAPGPMDRDSDIMDL